MEIKAQDSERGDTATSDIKGRKEKFTKREELNRHKGRTTIGKKATRENKREITRQ